MSEFPNITVVDPGLWLYFWLLIPLVVAISGLFLEPLVEDFTEKRRKSKRPVVGVGYIVMGIALLVGVMMFPVIGSLISDERDNRAVAALEKIGFQEVRLSLDAGTFGAYYDGVLMRGLLVEDQNHPGVYKVIRDLPPSSNTN